MSRIKSIETSIHQLPLDPPFLAAWDRQPRHAFPIAIFRVFDDEGRMGVGAGDAMRGLVDYVGLFVGEDPLDLARHSSILDNVAFFDGRPWPLEIALWDLAGKIRNQPIWQMVGGRSNQIRPYASSGTHWPIDQVEHNVQTVLDGGFGALKVRFGRASLDQDVEVLTAVHDLAGNRLDLMVDCNQGWRMPWDIHSAWTFEQALGVARRLEPLDVYWMEEPLHRADYEGMARLRAATDIRIAGGEMTREWYEFRTLLERGCLDVFQPDTAVTCGIERLRHFAHEVADAGHVFSPHTWGSGIALLANAHLTAGTVGAPYLEYPFDPPQWTAHRRDFLFTTRFEPDDSGWLTLPDAPGLGIELDETRLASTRTDSAAYR